MDLLSSWSAAYKLALCTGHGRSCMGLLDLVHCLLPCSQSRVREEMSARTRTAYLSTGCTLPGEPCAGPNGLAFLLS